jgi:hypothetical protein
VEPATPGHEGDPLPLALIKLDASLEAFPVIGFRDRGETTAISVFDQQTGHGAITSRGVAIYVAQRAIVKFPRTNYF